VIATGVYSRQLIGRSREISLLVERSRDIAKGSAMVVVRGEAGIGKSRLVGDFAILVQKEGKRLASGAAREFANDPYGQFAEALLALGVETLPPVADHGDDGKSGWYAAVTEALRTAITQTPHGVVIVLDDLHWADAATIDLLRFARSRLSDSPVLFVAAYRHDEIESNTARARALAFLERDADVITLQPLPPGQIEHLITGVLENIGRSVPPDVVAEIRDLSDGRPFFAEELLRGVLERLQRDERAIPTVPSSVRATVRERYASLNESSREILLHAAVFGRHFSANLVSDLLGIDISLVFTALRRARDLQLIVEDEGDDNGDRFAFRHALTREAIYGEMLRAEARIVHGRVAVLLASRPNAVPAEIAEHTWRARNGADAAMWNERAGDAAAVLYAYADAARFYERALRSSQEGEQRCRVAERAAEAWYAIGDVESSAAAYARAAEANRELGRHTRAGRLSLRRARTLFEAGHYDEGLAEANRLAVHDESVEPSLRVEAEVITAGLLVGKGRPLEALERLRRAETISTTLDAAIAARFSATYAYVLAFVGQPAQARSYFSETVRICETAGDSDMLLRTYNNWGHLELIYGTTERTSEIYGIAFPIARQTKNLRQTAWLAQNAALSALLAGSLDIADDFLKQGMEVDHGVSVIHRWSIALRLRLATLRGVEDESLVSRGLQLFDGARAASDVASLHLLGSALALHFASVGAGEEASRIVAEATVNVERADAPYWILDVACRFGERHLRERAREALAHTVLRTDARPALGFAAMADSREAQRQRNREGVTRYGIVAVDAFAQSGWHIEEAFALELAGRPADAVAAFRKVGALGEVRRITEISDGPRRRGDSTLTGREREVARLVVVGKSAKAIAEALVISERTVESHIASIYRKLGVSGRVALAQLLEGADS
jgi:predicted ATPase/DNA-binding CsgD family transcriptional regulator